MSMVTSSLTFTNHFLLNNNNVFVPAPAPSSSQLKPNRTNTQTMKKTITVVRSSNDFFAFSKSEKGGFLGGGGASVLERPKFDQSDFQLSTQLEEGGDMGRIRDRRGPGSGDSYRVLLIDDVRHTENLVMKVLPHAVPSVTPEGAKELFHLSRENGLAVVIVAVKEHAEFYADMIVQGGLRSTIEPDSSLL